MADFALNQADINSGLWRRLRKHMQAELDILRQQNDDMRLDAVATAEKRGRIVQLRELIALEDPAPGVET